MSMSEGEPLRELYPPIEPYNTGFLEVSSVHSLYYEECGNKDGLPVVFLHGGPGGGCSADDRRYFNPETYRIVIFDQRGAGRSKPTACLEDNTTWHLVADIEQLREHLSIDRWVVFGGSWGSTLSLTYAETHPSRVKALILRGIFTLRRKELVFFYQGHEADPMRGGSGFLYPDQFEQFLAPIPEVERGDIMSAYYRRLTGSDAKVQLECARAWSSWEMWTSTLRPNAERIRTAHENAQFALSFARIECHYFVNGGFFDCDDYVLRHVDRLREAKIPAFIVQGRYDLVCPMSTAWELHKKWPEAEFVIVQDAGHSAREPGIRSQLVAAADRFQSL
jgi:proline iminopeptidase